MSATISQSSTQMSEPADIPHWARPMGVYLACAVWTGVFAAIAIFMRSALVVDDAKEAYNAQSLEWSYSPRNPPLYDWLLYGLNQLTGTAAISAPLINYGSMFVCALLLYAVARRVIENPVLQALSVFSLALLWVIAFESHRILTHTPLMISIIAATVLLMWSLGQRRTMFKYVLLGLLIIAGLLSKYAYAIFIGVLTVAALLERDYRGVVLNPRYAISLVIGVLPLVAVRLFDDSKANAVVAASADVIVGGSGATLGEQAISFVTSALGYLMPFALIFLLAFLLPRPAPRVTVGGPDMAFLRLNRNLLLIGLAVMGFWAFGLGSDGLRPRYYHCVLLTAPLYAFMALDQAQPRQWQVRVFLASIVALTTVIAGIYLASRLAPMQALCQQCRASAPYLQLGELLQTRYGPEPTLVTVDWYEGGQLRAAMPLARVVALRATRYTPPPRRADRCLMVWQQSEAIDAALTQSLAPMGITIAPDETIVLDWWAPLLPDGRQTRFFIQALAPDAPPCL